MENNAVSWLLYAGVAVAFVGVLVYLAIHVVGLIRVIRSHDPVPISKLSLAAWIVSFAGGFMGPLVILMNLAALVMGVVALFRDVSERSKICAQTAVAAAVTILLMTLGMLAFIIPTL